jgi:capsular polysaccharide biosynthesis protein
VNDPERPLTWSGAVRDAPPEHPLDYQDTPTAGERADTDLAGAYTSLGFIGAALRRRRRLWCSLGVLGLLIGSAIYVAFPPSYQASATVLLTNDPSEDPANAIATNQSLAESNAVAAQVVHQLGLHQTVPSFQGATTVTVGTAQVLAIAVSAPSSSAAVARTSALAKAFLQFRATYLQNQQKLLETEINQQVSQAQQRLAELTREIDQLSAQPGTATQQARLKDLEAESGAQADIVQASHATVSAAQTTMTTMVNGSEVLNAAAPVHQSRVKRALLYVAGGLIAGLGLGMGIVIIMTLLSDRLRRRDDIADVIGAPVRLSVGPLQPKLLGLRGRAARDRDMKRVVAFLRDALPESSRDTASLAVVAVDNAHLVARAVVALAASCAREGKQVVLADLSGGVLAKRLGVRVPGISAVDLDGTHLVSVLPDGEDPAPAGPLNSSAQHRLASEALLTACASADLLLTLATLEPTLTWNHLATWATDAVATVTAGQSSAARIHAVGEMISLAGIRLESVVVINADKDDESLGRILAPGRTVPF